MDILHKFEQPFSEGRVLIGEPSTASELLAAFQGLVRRHFRLILFLMLSSIALGGVYAFTTPPSFTAQATVFIDPQRPFDKEAITTPDSEAIDSQVEILRSEKIALDVIKQLDLTKDPDLTGKDVDLGLIGNSIRSIRGWFRSIPGWFKPVAPHAESEDELTQRAAIAFANRLTAKRINLTSLIGISFSASNPDRAAEIANATANAYVTDQLLARTQAAKSAASWEQDRIRELGEQASAADHAVVEFKSQHNIVTVESASGGGQRMLNEQQLPELNSQLVVARNNTAEAKARLDRVQEILDAGVPDATVTDSLNNTVVSKLRSEYLDLAGREADWSAKYGPNHLAAINLRNQMKEIKASIVAELQRLAEGYKSDYQIAREREVSAQAALDSASAQSHLDDRTRIKLRELESTAQTYRALHDNFVQRYVESVQQQSFPITAARVITLASPPLNKSHPKTLLILAMSSLGGLILGLGIAELRDLLDRRFRTRAQVEARLHVDCIALVPALSNAPIKLKRASKQAPVWHVIDSPFSGFTESIRSIKITMDVARKPNNVIGVTSTLPDEGKSTIAASLAQVLAQAGASAILVDCDLRNPSLTRLLAPKASVGLLDLINGEAKLEDLVFVDPDSGLDFLPQAVKAPLAHSSQILASEASRAVFDRLRDRYDYVIADLSPLCPIVDVRATTHFIDSYVYVVRWGQKFNVVEHALSGATPIYEKLLGVVLNKVDMVAIGRHDGFGHGYYNNKYYSRYNQTG